MSNRLRAAPAAVSPIALSTLPECVAALRHAKRLLARLDPAALPARAKRDKLSAALWRLGAALDALDGEAG